VDSLCAAEQTRVRTYTLPPKQHEQMFERALFELTEPSIMESVIKDSSMRMAGQKNDEQMQRIDIMRRQRRQRFQPPAVQQ